MQTFLPHPDFRWSARDLDDKRLGKQRVETFQILRSLYGVIDGWKNHPATRMWRGYSDALVVYGRVVCRVWVSRGFSDTCEQSIRAFASNLGQSDVAVDDHFLNMANPTRIIMAERGITMPPFLLGKSSVDFHNSHKGTLYEKDPEFYPKAWSIYAREILWPVG